MSSKYSQLSVFDKTYIGKDNLLKAWCLIREICFLFERIQRCAISWNENLVISDESVTLAGLNRICMIHVDKMRGKGCRACLWAVFVVAAFCFWGWGYPFVLAWQEQFQLFLFDGPYLMDRLAVPGGLAAYVAECLVQFYKYPWAGAIILALLYGAVQGLMWKLMRRQAVGAEGNDTGLLYVLSFLPSLTLWLLMGDVNVMLAYTVSWLCVLGGMWLYPSGRRSRWLYGLLCIPLVYWIAGPLVLFLALYGLMEEMRSARSWGRGIGVGIGWLVYACLCIYVSAWLEPYPLRRLFVGLYYYCYPDILPLALGWMVVVVGGLLLLSGQIERWMKRVRKPVWIVSGVCLVGLIGLLALGHRQYTKKALELVEYDYLVRMQRWQDVIHKAEQRHADLPMSVCAVSLALGMTDQLGDRAFEFFQNGSQGLFPKFVRDHNTTFLPGEVYFHLGLVNTAQRYAFETMEAIPNYNKSGRAVQRLAETNLVNGQYKVAEKYLKMLEKTLFYRKWAKSRLEMVADTGLIGRHPVYGPMRAMRLQEDFLFSDIEQDKICGQLLMQNKGNRLAMQYLLVYPLLNLDLNSFLHYYSYVNSLVDYRPKACQEAAAFAAAIQKMEVPAGAFGSVVMERLKRFAQSYTFAGKRPSQDAFRDTYWNYFMNKKR